MTHQVNNSCAPSLVIFEIFSVQDKHVEGYLDKGHSTRFHTASHGDLHWHSFRHRHVHRRAYIQGLGHRHCRYIVNHLFIHAAIST